MSSSITTKLIRSVWTNNNSSILRRNPFSCQVTVLSSFNTTRTTTGCVGTIGLNRWFSTTPSDDTSVYNAKLRNIGISAHIDRYGTKRPTLGTTDHTMISDVICRIDIIYCFRKSITNKVMIFFFFCFSLDLIICYLFIYFFN